METWNDIRHADILAPTEDSASVPMNAFSDVPSLSTNDEVVDMGTDFDFEGFQVVRREFFAHLQVVCKVRLAEQVAGGLLCSGSRKSGN